MFGEGKFGVSGEQPHSYYSCVHRHGGSCTDIYDTRHNDGTNPAHSAELRSASDCVGHEATSWLLNHEPRSSRRHATVDKWLKEVTEGGEHRDKGCCDDIGYGGCNYGDSVRCNPTSSTPWEVYLPSLSRSSMEDWVNTYWKHSIDSGLKHYIRTARYSSLVVMRNDNSSIANSMKHICPCALRTTMRDNLAQTCVAIAPSKEMVILQGLKCYIAKPIINFSNYCNSYSEGIV